MPRIGEVGEMQKTPDFCEHITTGKYSLMDYTVCPECEGGTKIIRRCMKCGTEFMGDDYCVC